MPELLLLRTVSRSDFRDKPVSQSGNLPALAGEKHLVANYDSFADWCSTYGSIANYSTLQKDWICGKADLTIVMLPTQQYPPYPQPNGSVSM